jgi:hypothetical protein
VAIPKTALQLLRLPPLGVPRVDSDPGLADLADLSPQPASFAPVPPGYLSTVSQPPPPPVTAPTTIGPVILRDGTTLPPPSDVTLP